MFATQLFLRSRRVNWFQRHCSSDVEKLTLPITDAARQTLNYQWYWDHRDELLAQYRGKYVLADNGAILGVFGHRQEADDAWSVYSTCSC